MHNWLFDGDLGVRDAWMAVAAMAVGLFVLAMLIVWMCEKFGGDGPPDS